MSMRAPPERPLFIARRAYRRRRMIDAAALLPIIGALLFVLPLLWLGADGGPPRTSYVMLYLFAVWALLVILSALVTRVLGTVSDRHPDDGMDAAEEGAQPDSPARPG